MCYHKGEVSMMEEERQEQEVQQTQEYKPRPKWQVALAWVGLGVFVAFLVMYYIIIFRGGR